MFLIFVITMGTFPTFFGHWAINFWGSLGAPPSKSRIGKTEKQVLGALNKDQLYSKFYVIFLCCCHSWSHLIKKSDYRWFTLNIPSYYYESTFKISFSFIFNPIQNWWANSFSLEPTLRTFSCLQNFSWNVLSPNNHEAPLVFHRWLACTACLFVFQKLNCEH